MSAIRSRLMRTSLLAARSMSVKSYAPQMFAPLLKPTASNIKFAGVAEITKSYSTCSENTREKFDALVKNKDIVVFMKGTPEQPMCGFSRAVVQILMGHGAKFEAYNVLEDESIRSGIKEYTEWPTIPQVFFKGEFIGGCDILLEMHRSGDIIDELAAIGIKSRLAESKPEEK